MKIATWNLERLKHKSKLQEITQILNSLNADILVLTETDSRVQLPNYQNSFSTTYISEKYTDKYQPTEQRVTIISNYEFVQFHSTFDPYTSICVELKSELGNVLVYGTIIGIYGNRHPNFNHDLELQIKDFEKLSKLGILCIAGDFNLSFLDNYYFTNYGRDQMNQMFSQTNLELVTKNMAECIDHIVLSKSFTQNKSNTIYEWNLDKKLSDHKGICVEIN